MATRTKRPILTLTTITAILLTALAAYVLITTGDARADSSFQPTTIVKYCNDLPDTFPPDPSLQADYPDNPCFESSEPANEGISSGGHPKITTIYNLPLGDVNVHTMVNFSPNSMTIAPGASIPTGETVGGISWLARLGVINLPCNTVVSIDFLLYNIALPNNANPRLATNIVYPRPEEAPDRFGAWNVGSPAPYNGSDNVVDQMTASEGLSTNHAASTNLSVQNYPSYLVDAFDPDFVPGTGDNADGGANAVPLVPIAVYGGLTLVVGEWVPMYIVQFAAGQLTALTNSPLALLNANNGQPAVNVMFDPTAVGASPTSMTDFCSSLQFTTMLLGHTKQNNLNRVTNPGGTTQQFYQNYSVSERDLDQDGYENTIDTCPKATNIQNPRATAPVNMDLDADGIDDACDSSNFDFGDNDQDDDYFYNTGDNCPQDTNGLVTPTPVFPGLPGPHIPYQKEDELQNPPAVPDGPVTDGIGNPCDTGTITFMQNGLSQTVTLSPTVANGRYHTDPYIVPKCIGGTDMDGDGYCTTNDIFDSSAARHNAWAGATHPALQLDTDQDGVPDTKETWTSQCATAIVGQTITRCSPMPKQGFDPAKSCAQTVGALPAVRGDEGPLDNWGLDFDDNGLINGSDFFAFAPAFGKTVDQGTVNVLVANTGIVGIYRTDLNADGIVNGSDFFSLAPVFGKTCATAGIPPYSQQ